MHRTDSYFRRNPTGSSLRRFSFRRKPTRESLGLSSSIWIYENHQWQLARGNQTSILFFLIDIRRTFHRLQYYAIEVFFSRLEDGAQIQLVYNKSEVKANLVNDKSTLLFF